MNVKRFKEILDNVHNSCDIGAHGSKITINYWSESHDDYSIVMHGYNTDSLLCFIYHNDNLVSELKYDVETDGTERWT